MFKETLCFKSSWSSREKDPLSDNDQCSVISEVMYRYHRYVAECESIFGRVREDFPEERGENGLKGASVDEGTPGRKRM